jgi:hypothetical protein
MSGLGFLIPNGRNFFIKKEKVTLSRIRKFNNLEALEDLLWP